MNHEQFLLIKLAEEAAELSQIALKTAQFGFDEQSPALDEDNKTRIIREWMDLETVMQELERLNHLNRFSVDFDLHQLEKLSKLAKYKKYSQELGLVNE